jgi:thiamine-phosphate pyrophosphorylase
MTHAERLDRLFGLYGIVDDDPSTPLPAVKWAEALAAGGAAAVQLRFKHTPPKQALDIARAVRKVLPHTLLIIDDRPDLAMLADADGVHVGDDDLAPGDARRVVGPDRLVGATARTVETARAAVGAGADHLGVGPVFASRTKPLPHEPLGPERLGAICRAIAPVPVVAIAGIDAANLASVISAGARAAAVIAAVGRATDPIQAVRNLTAIYQASLSPEGERVRVRGPHGG